MATPAAISSLLTRLRPRGGASLLGTFTRNRLDWTAESLAWMSVSQIAVAAQFSFIALRNNDPASRVLVVFGYGFTSGVAGTASVAMRGAYGVLGVAAGSINPLYLSNAPPPGVSMAGSLAAAPGTLYGFPIIAAQPAAFYPSFPLMIVPPGWNFILCNQAVNAAINATVLYGLY